jgi:hypothetical protein
MVITKEMKKYQIIIDVLTFYFQNRYANRKFIPSVGDSHVLNVIHNLQVFPISVLFSFEINHGRL